MNVENYKLTQIVSKLKIIILSRLKKPSIEQWIEDRRDQCKVCPFNTKNMIKLSLKEIILIKLSDFYSWVTGNKEEDILGNCSACELCSIYYKTFEYIESCPKNKWKI